jgi:hypothetical protein
MSCWRCGNPLPTWAPSLPPSARRSLFCSATCFHAAMADAGPNAPTGLADLTAVELRAVDAAVIAEAEWITRQAS